MSEEINTQGWDAITAAFEKRYPDQVDPLHFGTLISWQLGGNDPLKGISVYDGGDYWHFVTYGFSELYEKEWENKEYSGFGFELTMKLKKASAVLGTVQGDTAGEGQSIDGQAHSAANPAGDDEIRCAAGVLQALGRYSFEDSAVFRPYEYIYTGQESGMDSKGISKLTGFVTVPDEAGAIETPNGRVEFVQLVGMSDRELMAIVDKEMTVKEAVQRLGHTLTDYGRSEIV